MFGNMCIGATHTERTNQPPAVGMRRVQAADHACANFHPFSGTVDSSLPPSTSPGPLPPSHPFRTSCPALFPASPSPFTDDDGVCVYRCQSPSTEGFSRFFSPRVYPTPRRVETVGAATTGVRRVQPSVLGLSLVSLVTAPHKGIAL